ncbi:MAG: hypothetical protein WCK37_02820 [Candidatus Falkowbacteria bacterium]
MFNENNLNINSEDKKTTGQGAEDVALPISNEQYQTTLKGLSREDIITQMLASGLSQEEADDWADDFDKDR